MKLYDKHLNSIDALKREKARLLVRKSYSKASDLMPVKDRKGGSGGSGIIGTVFSVLNSTGRTQQMIAVAGPLLRMISNRRKKARAAGYQRYAGPASPPEHKKPSFLKRAATEVIGGYIRWKAIEMGINAVQMVLRSRKRKKVQAQKMRMH